METLGCIYTWSMWEEQEEQPEVSSIQISSTPGIVILALILTPLLNLHPAIASTLLTQANQNQTVTTSQNDPQPKVEGSNEVQLSETVSSEVVCKAVVNSGYLGLGSVGEEVRLLQVQLNNWGFPVENVDGVFGPETCAAVVQFQSFHGLNQDGIVGSRTSQALWTPRTDNRDQMIQVQLNNWGFPLKTADGVFDPDPRAAIVQFQKYHDLEPNGIVDRKTSQALWSPRTKAIAQVTPSPAPTSSTTTEPSPIPTSTIVTEPSPTPASTPEPAEAIAQVTPSPTPTPEPPPVTNSTLESPEAIAQGTPSPSTDSTPTPEPSPEPDLTVTPEHSPEPFLSEECRKFLDRLAENESAADGGYRALAENTGNIGRYQFGEALLKDLGYYSIENPYLYEKAQRGGKTQNTWDGDWTELAESLGISKGDKPNDQDFLERIADAQDQIMREALTLNWFYFKNSLTGSTEREKFKNDYIEKLENGETIELKAKTVLDQKDQERLKIAEDGTESLRVTQAGILAAAHLVGAENATNFLFGKDEPSDENGTKATKYFKDLENFNAKSCMLPVRSPIRNLDGSPK